MLVDFISPEKLPDWLVWLDWNFYEHKLTLFMFVAVAFGLWVLWYLMNTFPSVFSVYSVVTNREV